jgi:tripartite-type tricarboxylate transporter receptor subunit TctC
LPGFELNIWYGLYAPKGTPKPVIDKLSATLQEALKDDKLKARFAQFGAEPASSDKAQPESLRACQGGDRQVGTDHQGRRGLRGIKRKTPT